MNVRIPCDAPAAEAGGTSPMIRINSPSEIQESYAAYLTDESRMPGGSADCILFAHSEKQVVHALREAAEKGQGVTVSAARTGITGGAVPLGGILLSLERMTGIRRVRWDSSDGRFSLCLEPGLTLQDLNSQLLSKTVNLSLEGLGDEERSASERFLEECDQWFYPVDPTEKSAHIGGTVTTNASGARSFHYGQTRDHITGLRVVLPDGSVIAVKRGQYVDEQGEGFSIECVSGQRVLTKPSWTFPEIKNAAGYYSANPMDFIDYFIGSEGTLGVITEVEVQLSRRPAFTLSGVAFFGNDQQALRFVEQARALKRSGHEWVTPSALEYFDGHSLDLLRRKRDNSSSESEIPPFSDSAQAAIYFEQSGKEEDVEEMYMAYDELLTKFGTSMDQTWGAMEEREIEQMTAFRHALPETINTIIGQRQTEFPSLHKVGTDFAVPDEAMDEMMVFYRDNLEKAQFEYAIFGHIGENHLHVNIIPRNEEEFRKAKALYEVFARKAVALGGTVSGEHGIGKMKKNMLEIMYPGEQIEAMRAVKEAVDPEGLLNKGNLF